MEKYKPVVILFGLSLVIWLLGSLITYPPYARIGAFTFFILGAGSLALGKDEIAEGSEEGLDGKSGKGSESSRKSLSQQKSSKKKRKRKNPATPKA